MHRSGSENNSRGGGQGEVAGLRDFRAGLYDCLGRWPDALFELADAALCQPGPISSVPALSLQPVFRRSHGSVMSQDMGDSSVSGHR